MFNVIKRSNRRYRINEHKKKIYISFINHINNNF